MLCTGHCVLCAVCCGLWAMVFGLWAVGCGLWAVGCGLWAVGCAQEAYPGYTSPSVTLNGEGVLCSTICVLFLRNVTLVLK